MWCSDPSWGQDTARAVTGAGRALHSCKCGVNVDFQQFYQVKDDFWIISTADKKGFVLSAWCPVFLHPPAHFWFVGSGD